MKNCLKFSATRKFGIFSSKRCRNCYLKRISSPEKPKSQRKRSRRKKYLTSWSKSGPTIAISRKLIWATSVKSSSCWQKASLHCEINTQRKKFHFMIMLKRNKRITATPSDDSFVTQCSLQSSCTSVVTFYEREIFHTFQRENRLNLCWLHSQSMSLQKAPDSLHRFNIAYRSGERDDNLAS